MTRPGKVRGELVKLYYQSGLKAVEALCVYHRNNLQRRFPCTPQDLHDFIKKFKGTGCTCNKPRSGWPIVSEDIVTEVHHTVTSGHMQTARVTASVLDQGQTRSNTVAYRP